MLSANLKGNDRISISVECSGPIKGLTVESNAFSDVRGYLKQVPIPIAKPMESFDLSPFFGAGFLTVTKFLEDAKHPFISKIMMENGSLAKDLALFHLKSEQVPTSFSLSVLFDSDGKVQGAGGLFLQALPGAQEDVLIDLERLVHGLPSMGQVVTGADFPEQWLKETFAELNPRLLHQHGIEFMCHCNRPRVRAILAMLEASELADMARNGPFPIEIRCHYCNTVYAFDQPELQAVYAERSSTD